jgi:hypothetical protein
VFGLSHDFPSHGTITPATINKISNPIACGNQSRFVYLRCMAIAPKEGAAYAATS